MTADKSPAAAARGRDAPGSPALLAHRVVRALVAQIRHGGVKHVVIAPGSRSTPLTLAFVSDPSFQAWLHLDERSAGYFALGLARQLHAPVAVVCTSGTAAANLLPAVVEASLSRVPLVLLTADRPPELRDVGANQTIDQVGLFGSHAKWAVELPIADRGTSADVLERHAAGVGARAAATAHEAPAGPVHVNVPLREPLVAEGWRDEQARRHAPLEVATAPKTDARGAAASFLVRAAALRGLIVCGPESAGLPAQQIEALARELGWPILADPLSGLRAGRHRLANVIGSYDALLRSASFRAAARPQAVLRFGAAPTSTVLSQYLLEHRGVPHFVVDAPGGWRDPDAIGTAMLRADPAALCDAAVEALRVARPTRFTGAPDDPARTGGAPRTSADWLELWSAGERVARSALRDAVSALPDPFEGRAPMALADALPQGATLVLGNSMPVRDADSFFPVTGRDLRLVGTRGASGIDGVVSTAVGAAAARGGPVALLIGDLSLLHDLNGLWPLRRYDLSLTVVLINNDGGGIFHFLPQSAQAAEHFEEWFGTPHGVDMEAAAALHGGDYLRLERGDEVSAMRDAVIRPGLHLLELRTDRVLNVEQHRLVWARVDAALREAARDDIALAPLLAPLAGSPS